MHDNVQCGLPTELVLTLTSGSCNPAEESPEFPYEAHFQPQVLHMLVGALTQHDMCFNPACPPAASALAGRCYSLTQPGMACTLSWLSCMPEGAVAWSCPAWLQTQSIQMVRVLRPCLAWPTLMLPNGNYSLVDECPNFPYQTCFQPWVSMCASGGSFPAWPGLPSVPDFACASGYCNLALSGLLPVSAPASIR